jgi:hypothetical protein
MGNASSVSKEAVVQAAKTKAPYNAPLGSPNPSNPKASSWSTYRAPLTGCARHNGSPIAAPAA